MRLCEAPSMATGPQLKAVLALKLHLHPVTVDRYLANLANAGLIRRSGLGGGKAAVHLSGVEYAYVFLSLASPSPSGAAAAAKALGRLFPENSQTGDASLLTSLTGTIEILAMQIRRGDKETAAGDDWELVLCLNPLMASMTWRTQAPDVTRRFFDYQDARTIAPPTEAAPIIRRQTVLTKSVLMIAARLFYADQNENAEAPGRASAPIADDPSPAQAAEGPDSRNSPGSTSRARASAMSHRSLEPCPTESSSD